MSEKYEDEHDLFFTFFHYIDQCFAENDETISGGPKSLDECYDWSTVLIENNEELPYIQSCFDKSFAIPGDLNTDNRFLREDRQWAMANHMHMHPAITVNNYTYTNSTGQDLALAIC